MKRYRKGIIILLILSLLLVSLYYVFTCVMPKAETSHKVLDYPEIEARERLIVVTDYSPIGYYIKGDTVEGFNYDLLQMFQQYTNAKIEIVLETSLKKSLDGLSEGKYNIVARNIPITSNLKNSVFFSDPIMQNRQVLVQRKAEYNEGKMPIRSHLDLAEKTLYVSKNDPVILRLNNLSKEIGDTIYYVEDEDYGAEQLTIMVAQQEIDFAVCDEKTARKMASSQPELDIETTIGFTHFEAWAVSKHSPILLDSLNSWISKVKTTKKYQQIYQAYSK